MQKKRQKDKVINKNQKTVYHDYYPSNVLPTGRYQLSEIRISVACLNFTHLSLREVKVLIMAVLTYLVVYTLCEKLVTVYQWLTKILGSHNFIFTVPREFNFEACVFPSQGEV